MLYLKEKQFNKKGLSWQMDCMRHALRMYGHEKLANLNKSGFQKLLSHLLSLPIKVITVREHMSVLRAVIYWSADRGLCDKPIFPRLPKAEPEKFIPPTFIEIENLLASSPPHLQRVLILGSNCGLRIGPSELFSLQWTHIDFKERIIRVPPVKKNLKAAWRQVPLKDNLIAILSRWAMEDSLKKLSLGYKL